MTRFRILLFVLVASAVCNGAADTPPAKRGDAAGRKPGGAPAGFEVRTFKGKDGHSLDYSLFVPPNLKAGEKIPLVLCLHGAGGNTEAAKVLSAPARQAKQSCIIVAPGCDPRTARWVAIPGRAGEQRSALPELMGMLETLIRELPVDADRVYLTGQSMGGVGTWGIIAAHPERFAAAVPICGMWQAEDAAKMVRVPVWAFHGEKDPTVPVEGSRKMIAAMKAAGASPRYTEFPGVGHNSWTPAYAAEEMWEWMFAQRRKPKVP